MQSAESLAAWKRADLHMHTSFSGWRSLRILAAQDCYVSPDAAFATARARGMDFVCFTDHDTIDGALDFLARHPEAEPRVIVGEEVEATFPDTPCWIHVNVFHVDEALHADLARLRSDGWQLLAELRRRRLFYTLNHPFQSFRSIATARRFLETALPLFPAVEVCNGTSPRSHVGVLQALLLSDELRHLVAVGGSDAHTRRSIASVWTAAPATTKYEYVESLRAGRCEIGGEARGPRALVGDVYAIIGEFYRRLYLEPRPRSAAWYRSLIAGTMLLPAVVGGVPAAVTAGQVARQEWIARFGGWTSRLPVRCQTSSEGPA